MSEKSKICKQCKAGFEITVEDLGFYQKIGVPPPTHCPLCRQERRISFRNFKTLYKRPSDKSGASTISMYHPKSSYKVYTHEEWWADDWDPMGYGRDFDFNRPFFDQFHELQLAVPRYAVMNTKSENCEYSNLTFESKNCYLVFGCVNDENCAYGHIVWNSIDSFDNLYIFKCELCYECVDCLGSNRLFHSQECESCTDSIGLYDCRGCTSCIGCVGLRQKSYCIFNEEVGKEAYQAFLKEHPLHNPETIPMILEKREQLRRKLPQRHFFGYRNTNVSGNHIYNAKNVHYSFDVKGGENSKYVFTLRNAIDLYDCSFSPDLEHSYECLAGQGMRQYFCRNCVGCNDICHSEDCFSSQNLFGCVGLRTSEYCILNKQYDKESFGKLRTRIINHMKETGEWGEFPPAELSAFAYNESIVNEYIPRTKEEIAARGLRWENDIPRTKGQETIPHNELPKNPKEFTPELEKHVLACTSCGGNYRLIPIEIGFLKNAGLPIPRECFNCRHQRRMDSRNPRELWPGTCNKCGKALQTSYPPEKQKEFTLYCESCYAQETV